MAGRKLMRTNSFPTLAPPLPGVIESLAPCPALEEAGRGVAEVGGGVHGGVTKGWGHCAVCDRMHSALWNCL